MKKVYQTRYGKNEGNCFPAAIASILELELDEVPDFCNIHSEDSYYQEFIYWLHRLGYTAIPIATNKDELANSMHLKGSYLLVTGKNKDGVNHCVVYRNGEMVHNPNRKCEGITPEYLDIIYPMNPMKSKLKGEKVNV